MFAMSCAVTNAANVSPWDASQSNSADVMMAVNVEEPVMNLPIDRLPAETFR